MINDQRFFEAFVDELEKLSAVGALVMPALKFLGSNLAAGAAMDVGSKAISSVGTKKPKAGQPMTTPFGG